MPSATFDDICYFLCSLFVGITPLHPGVAELLQSLPKLLRQNGKCVLYFNFRIKILLTLQAQNAFIATGFGKDCRCSDSDGPWLIKDEIWTELKHCIYLSHDGILIVLHELPIGPHPVAATPLPVPGHVR